MEEMLGTVGLDKDIAGEACCIYELFLTSGATKDEAMAKVVELQRPCSALQSMPLALLH